MKIVIAGSGGVGGYYGAMLARAGHDLFFIARGEHLDKIYESGLVVKSFNGDFHITAGCGTDSSAFGAADLVIVSVKSYDTADTFDLYRSSVGPDTMILSLQNGIDNETILADEFGADCVLGGIAFIGSRVEVPGVILHTAFGHIAIGELATGIRERAERLKDLFESAGVKCRLSENIKQDLWGKMIWNVGFNAICAALDSSAKEAVEFEHTRETVRTAMLEWIEVAKKCEVDLNAAMADKNIEVTLNGGEVIPSLLHDKRRGRKMEIETFNGKVAQLGKSVGVATPVNDTLAAIVRYYNHKIETG